MLKDDEPDYGDNVLFRIMPPSREHLIMDLGICALFLVTGALLHFMM